MKRMDKEDAKKLNGNGRYERVYYCIKEDRAKGIRKEDAAKRIRKKL